MKTMTRKAVAAVLGGALALGSFLCLGMDMEMGTAWAPEQSHDCCPGDTGRQPSESNCCLLSPGAMSAPVTLSALFQVVFVLPTPPLIGAQAARRNSVLTHGPPGIAISLDISPASPRAPPVA